LGDVNREDEDLHHRMVTFLKHLVCGFVPEMEDLPQNMLGRAGFPAQI